MRNSISRLKFLPWRSLFQAAMLTVLLVALPIDVLLQLAVRYREQLPVLNSLLSVLLSPLLSLLVSLSLSVGLGAAAVYILERYDRFSISTGSLWALVLCLMLVLLIEKWLLFGTIAFSMVELVLIAVGVFWKGRPYWQSYRRW